MNRRVVLVFGCCLLYAGCGKYSDFTLPPPRGEQEEVTFQWELLDAPVLGRGQPGDWDEVDALNPSVVLHGGLYYNLYSGYDGVRWHTGLATSSDGLKWTKQGKVLSPDASTWEGDYIAANGSVIVFDAMFYYWYQAGEPPKIGLATSTDGIVWNKHATPVLETGPRGSWDERGVADPYVIQAHGKLFMFFLGQDRARRQRIGVAMSEDGSHWWKLRSNPILELGSRDSFDEIGLGEPAVWTSYGRYWMLYTGRDKQEYRRLGLASSDNGVNWNRISGTAVLEGQQPWNSKVVCDPSVELSGERIRVWFGGGNIAHPAENLNGQIGLAILRPESANLAE